MAKVQVKDIMLSFNVSRNMVRQVNSRQLFIVDTSYLGAAISQL